MNDPVISDNNPELAHRFKFHPANDDITKAQHSVVRNLCGELAQELDQIVPSGREKALAMTNLEQTMMWANAAIARAGSNG